MGSFLFHSIEKPQWCSCQESEVSKNLHCHDTSDKLTELHELAEGLTETIGGKRAGLEELVDVDLFKVFEIVTICSIDF